VPSRKILNLADVGRPQRTWEIDRIVAAVRAFLRKPDGPRDLQDVARAGTPVVRGEPTKQSLEERLPSDLPAISQSGLLHRCRDPSCATSRSALGRARATRSRSRRRRARYGPSGWRRAGIGYGAHPPCSAPGTLRARMAGLAEGDTAPVTSRWPTPTRGRRPAPWPCSPGLMGRPGRGWSLKPRRQLSRAAGRRRVGYTRPGAVHAIIGGLRKSDQARSRGDGRARPRKIEVIYSGTDLERLSPGSSNGQPDPARELGPHPPSTFLVTQIGRALRGAGWRGRARRDGGKSAPARRLGAGEPRTCSSSAPTGARPHRRARWTTRPRGAPGARRPCARGLGHREGRPADPDRLGTWSSNASYAGGGASPARFREGGSPASARSSRPIWRAWPELVIDGETGLPGGLRAIPPRSPGALARVLENPTWGSDHGASGPGRKRRVEGALLAPAPKLDATEALYRRARRDTRDMSIRGPDL